MARPGLTGHRKFRRLARSLGSAIVARGALELLWEPCYESGDEYIGTSDDIETLVGWAGERGMLTRALVEAGAPEGHGFIEPVDLLADLPAQRVPNTRYRIHDLWGFATATEKRLYRTRREKRRYRQRHPDRCREYRRARRAAIRGAGGSLSTAEWQAIIAEFDWCCAYCGTNVSDEATQDHVVPLSRGGRHDRTNIVPACRPCNNRKGVKTAAEFGYPALQRADAPDGLGI